MKKIVGISFKEVGKIYWFNPNFLKVKVGDMVIVETVRGLELGFVVAPIKEVEDNELEHELKDILRIASEKDIRDYKKYQSLAKESFVKAKRIIEQQKLSMKTLDCEYTLDGTKLLIYYTAEGRVDFRELVKVLASEFHVRIELRQVGPREGAKMIGGLGPCGRVLCCNGHLREFDLVTMKMAKDQGMALSANKIAGSCGKLMCCIAYENEAYDEKRKKLPCVGDIVKTPNCPSCKVTAVNYLKEEVQTDNEGLVEKWEAKKVQVLKSAKKEHNKASKEELELRKQLEEN